MVSLAVLGGVLIRQQSHSLRTAMELQAAATADLVATVAATYVSNRDRAALENLVKQISRDADVSFAEFRDVDGKSLTNGASKPPADSAGMMVFERTIKDPAGKTIGLYRLGYKADSVEANVRASIVTALCGIAVVLVVLTVGLALSVRRVVRPVRAIGDALGKLAEGDSDLTARLRAQSDDELGAIVSAFNRVMEKLQALVQSVRVSATEVAGAAVQLAQSTTEVQERSTQQNEATATTAAAVEQLTVSITHVADHTEETRRISEQASRVSERGRDVAQTASAEMTRIAASVKESASAVETLSRQSSEISGIVKVIRGIADQTNLLALNAAIEAARAGEQGRGFAVVADEVRKLAERTSSATTDIAGKIDAIQKEIHNAVARLESGSSEVTGGVKLAEQVAQALAEINDGAKRTLDRINEIAAATREQGSASSSIAQNIERIAQITDGNCSAVRESSLAAGDLEMLANGMLAEVARFKT